MNNNRTPYQVVDLSAGRIVWLNTLDLSWLDHAIYGLLEVDVTRPRQVIAAHRALTGEALSFTGYLTFCLARAVDADKSVQAFLKGRKQLVIFDDVDVSIMIENNYGGKKALMGHIIRAANRKTYREIHDEIRRVQTSPPPPGRGMPGWFRKLMVLPPPLPRLVRAVLAMISLYDPARRAAMTGTVGITSVGMFGRGYSGWGISPTGTSLGLVAGGIAWKPAVCEGRIEPREILNLTVMFDHDVVDGGPAARFVHRLVTLIESGEGMDAAASDLNR